LRERAAGDFGVEIHPGHLRKLKGQNSKLKGNFKFQTTKAEREWTEV
jgi:hypothetical protein